LGAGSKLEANSRYNKAKARKTRLTRIRVPEFDFFLSFSYEEVLVATQPNHKKQWTDMQVKHFFEEIQTDLQQLEASTYSLKDEVACLQTLIDAPNDP
jgi:uncharacterized protein YllA (UPF0747 family)